MLRVCMCTCLHKVTNNTVKYKIQPVEQYKTKSLLGTKIFSLFCSTSIALHKSSSHTDIFFTPFISDLDFHTFQMAPTKLREERKYSSLSYYSYRKPCGAKQTSTEEKNVLNGQKLLP